MTRPYPFPAPTPYQPPKQGGNPYIKPGTVGISISQKDYPIANLQGGWVLWASGKKTPHGSVSLPTDQPQQSQQQQQQQVSGAFTGSGGQPTNNRSTSGGPTNPSPVEQPQEDPMERIRQEVESIYAPLMDYYNQAEASITSEYERYKPELEQQYATSLSKLQTEKERGERELQAQQEAALQRREDALSAARRLYSELRRGGLQRFGGASSAGQAFTELTNVEQQRQAGNIWNLYQQAENQIARYKANIIDQFNQDQKELELAKTSALNQAYSDYQNRLNQIRAMKAQTQAAKAQMALEALYTLRNQVNQINLANLNLAQQLAAQKDAALNYVDRYAQKVANSIMGGRGTYASFEQQTTTSPTSQTTIGGRLGTVVPSYQGQIQRRPEEEYLYG